ncbi:hypothetical protein AWB78_07884 [Caballeronia calidae]|uniref:Uncharacterized protein n=1 Tax=Caballeronia calidae TaxID=1777139 RepID=A0A158EH23_9BURK|nr:hypothetical protein [Caballeronia calidae]SAL06114.1 hypothetical protein AWB78_07884 [Caballeronia calidae]
MNLSYKLVNPYQNPYLNDPPPSNVKQSLCDSRKSTGAPLGVLSGLPNNKTAFLSTQQRSARTDEEIKAADEAALQWAIEESRKTYAAETRQQARRALSSHAKSASSDFKTHAALPEKDKVDGAWMSAFLHRYAQMSDDERASTHKALSEKFSIFWKPEEGVFKRISIEQEPAAVSRNLAKLCDWLTAFQHDSSNIDESLSAIEVAQGTRGPNNRLTKDGPPDSDAEIQASLRQLFPKPVHGVTIEWCGGEFVVKEEPEVEKPEANKQSADAVFDMDRAHTIQAFSEICAALNMGVRTNG